MIARLRGSLGRAPAPVWMLLSIVFGFGTGTLLEGRAEPLLAGARLLGGLWIDSLRMTILPLVFALVVTGVADLATGGDHAGRRIGKRLPAVLIGFLLLAAILAAVIVPPLLATFSLSPEVAAGFRASVPSAPAPPAPSVLESIRMMIPVNVVASAAQGAVVPMVIFALVLGLSLTRIDSSRATTVLSLFKALADAMIVVVGWVLRIAPFGIFPLALVIGATAGGRAALALGHYILVQVIVAAILTAIPYLLVPVVVPGLSLPRFARAIFPAQAVAAGTQSSIATLPAMLASAERLGVSQRHSAVILPLAVAVFKVTAPSGALIYALSAAWLTGVEVPTAQVLFAIPIALLSTLLVIGVPGPASIIAASTPTALALGVPLEMITILIAVDTIPDMFRTVANVTADVAATAMIASPARVTARASEVTLS